jgi:hypothetical protein
MYPSGAGGIIHLSKMGFGLTALSSFFAFIFFDLTGDKEGIVLGSKIFFRQVFLGGRTSISWQRFSMNNCNLK